MPEPDFDQLALAIAKRLDTEALDDADMAYNVNIVREQLRLVWNARGTADIDAILAPVIGARMDIELTIRKLDR